MKLFFMGTPQFALPSLNALAKSPKHQVRLVISQPDKPKGRGLHSEPSDVKVLAEKLGIDVLLPEKLKESRELLKAFTELKPDAVVVVAYGKIIPESMLGLTPGGFINVHASILPEFRGASPINHAIISGCRTTGVSIMKIDKGLDTGPVYKNQHVDISNEDDAVSLSEKLSKIGSSLLLEVLDDIESGTASAIPQDDFRASHAHILKKTDGLIDWNCKASEIGNKVRGLLPWPCAYTYLEGKSLKILKAKTEQATHGFQTGTIFKFGRNIKIACLDGFIIPEILQLEGRKAMDALAFANGLKSDKIKLGDIII